MLSQVDEGPRLRGSRIVWRKRQKTPQFDRGLSVAMLAIQSYGQVVVRFWQIWPQDYGNAALARGRRRLAQGQQGHG